MVHPATELCFICTVPRNVSNAFVRSGRAQTQRTGWSSPTRRRKTGSQGEGGYLLAGRMCRGAMVRSRLDSTAQMSACCTVHASPQGSSPRQYQFVRVQQEAAFLDAQRRVRPLWGRRRLNEPFRQRGAARKQKLLQLNGAVYSAQLRRGVPWTLGGRGEAFPPAPQRWRSPCWA